jgi:peptide methionine sulfoxide reductase MsrB
MSTPNVSVVIEPSDGASVVYEPAAPKATTDKPLDLLCLELSITNHELGTVHLNKVSLSFSAPPSVPGAVIPVPTNWWPPGGSGVNIPPGEAAVWNFLREGFENDTVVLPSPAPASVTVSLFFDGFSAPWTATRTLAPHTNPVTDDSYLYPARFDDLRPGEFWNTSSDTHGTGAQGSQLFAYDMNVVAFDTSKGQINRLLPGTDGSKNEHYRVWGKKLHAMADGTVVHFLDGVGANFFPGTGNISGPWQEPPWNDPAKAWSDHVGAGNHFYIRHGSEVVLYAHMQKGTLNPNLLMPNAPVKAGDYLGLAGNAGSASEPHLHIHAINGTEAESGPLRPLLFHDIFAVDPSLLSLPNITGPWARVERQGPPVVPSGAFIWPLGRNPEWNGWQDLGGPITAPPAVASWAPHRLDVFAAGTDNQLDHKWWDGSIWHNFQTLGGTFKEGPAAVSWGPNRIDVFVRGMDDHLGHLWWDGSQWRGWQDLGGPLASGPAVSSWAPNRLDVFAKGSAGQLVHKWWDGSTWHNWQTLGGTFKEAPAVVSWGPNRIDVFVRGTDDHLGHLWWDGNQWRGWEDLGGPLTSGPAVASWGQHRLDVFAAGADGQLTHKWWDGLAWSDWDWVGGSFQGHPAAVSWGPNRIDVFVRGTDNHLGHLWRD